MAQALLAEPELLVLDEAWTGLDADARAELERAVAEQAAAGGSVVFVDHDPGRLAGASDAVYCVRDGTLHRRTGPEPVPSGPRVVVRVQGPPGADLPGDVRRTAASAEETGPGSHTLTVGASHSDVLLRTLLTARPPWHVVSVHAPEDHR